MLNNSSLCGFMLYTLYTVKQILLDLAFGRVSNIHHSDNFLAAGASKTGTETFETLGEIQGQHLFPKLLQILHSSPETLNPKPQSLKP